MFVNPGKFKSGVAVTPDRWMIIVNACPRGLVSRLQAVILCPMNSDHCFMKRVAGVLIFVMLTVTGCSAVQESPSDAVAEAAPGPVQAAPEADAQADLPPTDPDVMYHVFSAEVLGADGDYSGAAAEYLKAALKSEDPEIAERAAKVAVSAGEWQMVTLASDRWAMLDPESLDAHELAAGSRLREGDFAGAEYQLAKILALTNDDQEEGWNIVISLLAPIGDEARANKMLDRLLEDSAGEPDAGVLFARSRLAAAFGDVDQAFELADEAIKLAPRRADLLAWSGRLAVNLGEQTLALNRYRQAWEADPGNQQVAIAYAELLKRNGELKAAQEVLAQLPDTPDMRFARIAFAMEAGDMENAEALYRGFYKARYDDKSEAAFQAAQSAELLEHKREAIDWYEKVTGENSMRSIMRRAFLLADLGDVESARHLLAQLRLRGDIPVKSQSYQAEAQILQDAGDAEQAMTLLDEALGTMPDDVSLRYMRALTAVGLGQLELAENDLRLIISEQPDNAAAINALGYTLADLTDRYAEAEELINQAYELQPDDASIIDSRG